MTNEQAIKEIKDASDSEVRYGDVKNHYEKIKKRLDAFDKAIKALEIVSNLETVEIIKDSQFNNKSYNYKCGLADGLKFAMQILECNTKTED